MQDLSGGRGGPPYEDHRHITAAFRNVGPASVPAAVAKTAQETVNSYNDMPNLLTQNALRKMANQNKIHPVVMAVPEPDRHKKGREKVAALREAARVALRRSAQHSGVSLGELEKNDAGAPLPCNGVHWSLTHKADYVAAVTAPAPIGIDIEKDRPCSEGVYRRLAGKQEWALAPQVTQRLFFRYWTAKEAVLKAVGMGLTGLSRCKIAKILDDTRLELTYDGNLWRVAQCWVTRDHIVAVTADDADIEWHLPD